MICPKCDTGGGPCYCCMTPSDEPVDTSLRRWVLRDEYGMTAVVFAATLSGAIELSGAITVVSCTSTPVTAFERQAI